MRLLDSAEHLSLGSTDRLFAFSDVAINDICKRWIGPQKLAQSVRTAEKCFSLPYPCSSGLLFVEGLRFIVNDLSASLDADASSMSE